MATKVNYLRHSRVFIAVVLQLLHEAGTGLVHCHRGLLDFEPVALWHPTLLSLRGGSGSSDRQFAWVVVQEEGNDGSISAPARAKSLEADDPFDIHTLKKAVKAEFVPRLDHVAVADLKVWDNERELRPSEAVTQQSAGIDSANPLRVTYPPPAGAESRLSQPLQMRILTQLEELGKKQEKLGKKQEKLGKTLGKKQDMLVREQERLRWSLKSIRKTPGPKTRSQMGREVEKWLHKHDLKGPIEVDDLDSSPACSSQELHRIRCLREEKESNKAILEILSSLLKGRYAMVESERIGWLDGRMPDMSVLYIGYWEGNTEKGWRIGKPAHRDVWDTVRCIVEGKLDKIDNSARGQGREYAQIIGGRVNILLVDKKLCFEAFEYDDGAPKKKTEGILTDPGTRGFLQTFLLRPSDPIPDHQRDVEDALACLGLKLPDGAGFLGMGGSAVAVRVFDRDEADDTQPMVLKVFRAERAATGEREIRNLQKFDGVQTAIPRLIRSCTLSSGAVAVLTTPVGSRAQAIRDCVAMFSALSEFHRAGWYHGDARVCNFVKNETKVWLIDLETSGRRNGDNAQARDDLFRLASSVLCLKGCSDLRQDPVHLIRLKFPLVFEKFDSACFSYLKSGCGHKEVVDFADVTRTTSVERSSLSSSEHSGA